MTISPHSICSRISTKTNIPFIQYFDWKQDVNDLNWYINYNLQKHFHLTIILPDPRKYGDEVSISSENVVEDYDCCLRNHGLQWGCMDTEADEYILFIHRVADINEIESAVNAIGFDYYEYVNYMYCCSKTYNNVVYKKCGIQLFMHSTSTFTVT